MMKMINKKLAMIGVVGAALICGVLTVAATASAATKGEQMLQNMINEEAARAAELNVQLDPAQGIIHSLRKRSSGNDVKLLQQFLKTYGAYPEGQITGYFGPLTEAAVKRFQMKEGIEAAGIAGPKTRARIREISREQAASALATSPASSSSSSSAITAAVLASVVADNGSAAAAANSFASTTQNIYAVLSLKDVPQDAQIGCIRYYQGNYVDSVVSHPSRSDLAYLHFQWSLKPGSVRMPGNYALVFYLNGKNVKTIQYSIY